MSELQWRKARASQGGNNCVEVALDEAGGILVRNSNRTELGTISFTRAELGAWIAGCKAGEFDDLA
jgi:hypothetical protein